MDKKELEILVRERDAHIEQRRAIEGLFGPNDPQRQEHVCFPAEARGEHQIRASKKAPGTLSGLSQCRLKPSLSRRAQHG